MEVVKTTTKHDKYFAYKDSGVEWLGEIPKDWTPKKVFHYFRAEKGRNAAILTREFCGTIEGKFPVYSGQTENNGVMALINEYEFDYSKEGCLFTTTVGAKAMSVSFIKDKFSLSQNCMIIIRRNKKVLNKFFFYQFQAIFQFYRKLIPDHMQASFRMEDLYQYHFILPSFPEQTAIATFLDDKTTKIDTGIAQKEQMIALLKERKQIIIQNAVTKGLDPNAKMKDSGVEWIGEIPEGWKVKKVKYCLKSISEKVISKDSEFSYIGMENIESKTGKRIESENESEGLSNKFNEGDILFGKLRPYLAKVFLADIEGICSTEFIVYRTQHPQYFHKLLLSDAFINLVDSSTYGAKMPRANADWIGEQLIPIPQEYEQKEISNYIELRADKIDRAISLQQSQIEKLKEYKATLIDSAVTGKIKVTGE